jgi:hypothetical protein
LKVWVNPLKVWVNPLKVWVNLLKIWVDLLKVGVNLLKIGVDLLKVIGCLKGVRVKKMAKDYIPGSINGFNTFFHHIYNYTYQQISGSAPLWTHIPQASMDEFGISLALWDNVRNEAKKTPTPGAHQNQDSVHKEAEKMLRVFVNRYLRDDPVTDKDRIAMNIPTKDATRTLVAAPSSVPFITKLVPKIGHMVVIHFRDEYSDRSKAIPYGYSGCFINFHIGQEKVDNDRLLERTLLVTRSPSILHFDSEDVGMWLSVSARWQLKRQGILGPPSPTEHVLIN